MSCCNDQNISYMMLVVTGTLDLSGGQDVMTKTRGALRCASSSFMSFIMCHGYYKNQSISFLIASEAA